MTDEQIKQNAEEYAHKVNVFAEDENIYLAAKDGYMSGAHSRDEEIKELQVELMKQKECIKDYKEKLEFLKNQHCIK